MDKEKIRATLRSMYEGAAVLWEGPKSADHLTVDLDELFADDVKLYNPDSTPWGGLRVGVDEIASSMPFIQANIGTRKIRVRNVMVDGQYALVLVDLEYANNAGDQTAHTTVAEYFRFNEAGKVVEVIVHFFDTAAMLAFKSGASPAEAIATA
jgi:ketosteroid isomerase-like protein